MENDNLRALIKLTLTEKKFITSTGKYMQI